MYMKQKRLGRRLERRNASKNIDYDAATFSSSSSSPSSSLFDIQSAQRTRSLDISLLSDRTSYRIEGIEGEFDLICRSLGLSGPEDFAIPAAAWEAHKAYSPTGSNYFSGSGFRCFTPSSTEESPGSDFSESFESTARASDDEVKRDTGCLRSASAEEARVLASNGGKKRGDDVSGSGISEIKRVSECSGVLDDGDGNSCKARETCYVEGENRIKGVRPPLLAPPPAMSRVIVDNLGSSWDLIRGFGPRTNEGSTSVGPVEVIRSLAEEAVAHDGPIFVKGGVASGMMTLTAILPPSVLDTFDDEDDVCSIPATALECSVSPNGTVSCSIKNWQKGDFLGSGSFGTVYEGFTDKLLIGHMRIRLSDVNIRD